MKVSEPAVITVRHASDDVSMFLTLYQIRNTANDPVHYAICDICKKHIKGVRYKVSTSDLTSYSNEAYCVSSVRTSRASTSTSVSTVKLARSLFIPSTIPFSS